MATSLVNTKPYSQVNTRLVFPKLGRMDMPEVRRQRLRLWLATHPVPPKEKSYFSQLLTGTASFGERAARRLEKTYKMGAGFLDTVEEGALFTGTMDASAPEATWPFPEIAFERVEAWRGHPQFDELRIRIDEILRGFEKEAVAPAPRKAKNR